MPNGLSENRQYCAWVIPKSDPNARQLSLNIGINIGGNVDQYVIHPISILAITMQQSFPFADDWEPRKPSAPNLHETFEACLIGCDLCLWMETWKKCFATLKMLLWMNYAHDPTDNSLELNYFMEELFARSIILLKSCRWLQWTSIILQHAITFDMSVK